jgi:hypothetical protein
MAVGKTSATAKNLIRTSVPNLISGVSQQADAFKLASQASEQTNAISSVIHGLVKRTGTDWIRDLSYGTNVVPISYHWINRGNGERYIAILLNNTSTSAKTMRVFDLAGTEQTFYEYTTGTTLTNYFSGATEASVKSLTIADYTFFVNSNKIVAESSSLTSRALAGSTQVYQGMIVVKQGYAGRDQNNPSGKISWNYKIVSKTGVTFATGTGNSGTGSVSGASGGTDGFDAFKATDGGNSPVAIAKALVAGLSVTSGTAFATGSYKIFSEGSNVYIQHESVDFDIVTDDGYGQTLFYPIKDQVQNFSDLPSIAPHNFVTKIAGLPEDTGDEYYVKHTSSAPTAYLPSGSSSSTTPKGVLGISDGVWEECVAPAIKYKFDVATMPHALVKIASGKFLFTPLNGDNTKSYGGTAYTTSKMWGERIAGDTDTNPFPSFSGKAITNLFFYKNRLGVLSGENVILSEAGEFFNFFRVTLTQLLDSDVIDITSSTSEVGTLYHAVPFYDRLVLFADKVQFSLQSDGDLTPKSVSLQQSTSFDLNSNCPPKAVGTKILFTFDRSGNYTGVQEYFINDNTILLDGVDITSNLTTYLSGSAKLITGSEVDNIVLTLSDSTGSQNEVGVYKFFYNGAEKVQSAWSKFDFGTGAVVETAEIFDSKIYWVISRNGNRSLEVMDLDIDKVSSNTGQTGSSVVAPFKIHLDKKTTNLTSSANGSISDNGSTANYTIFNTPFSLNGSPAWSTGTNTSSSGYFKVPASEVIVVKNGVTYQGYRVYRNSSTNVLQFNSTGVLQTTQIMVKDNIYFWTPSTDLTCGITYPMNYNLSQPILRTTAGRGQSAIADGRLQIRNGILLYSNSRYFQIKVTPKYKDTYTYTYLYNFVTNYLGVGPTNLDYVNFEDGKFKFPVFTKADEMNVLITNDSPYGCSLLSLEWEALYSARSTRGAS